MTGYLKSKQFNKAIEECDIVKARVLVHSIGAHAW